MSVNIGDKFDSFTVISIATQSALQDYNILAKWFQESLNKDDQIAANQLYQWFCNTDNKGTLAFNHLSKISH